ncbi:transposase family protein [[Pseudopropionibacterium] massiliense]|uniref:transposase family protein n=1 Tax=[Pseudopropionibacterium] massiliense TaxID=2220000 RepID=UPI001A915226|nr:transposase family protein [[Pseudopropionibacterium] massiliense]
MNTTTSLDRNQILNLCELIHTSRSGNLPAAGSRTLGLFRCIQVTLLTLRHNLTQELLADIHTVSQATISRVVAVYTPLIAEALQAWVPGVGDLDRDRQYIIDGTLGVLLVVARPSRAVLRQIPHHRGEPAGGLHPDRTARLDLKTISGSSQK